jgi:hypothetical protein
MSIENIRNIKALAEYPKKTKRQEQEREFEIKRKIYLKKHPLCECGCKRKSWELHHKRGRVGTLLTDERYFIALSRTCHRRAELFPAWAKTIGLSESRLKKA